MLKGGGGGGRARASGGIVFEHEQPLQFSRKFLSILISTNKVRILPFITGHDKGGCGPADFRFGSYCSYLTRHAHVFPNPGPQPPWSLFSRPHKNVKTLVQVIFNAEHLVRIRVLMLTTALRPFEGIADLYMVDPDGFVIRKWNSKGRKAATCFESVKSVSFTRLTSKIKKTKPRCSSR